MSSQASSGAQPPRAQSHVAAALHVDAAGGVLRCDGDWSVFGLPPLDRRLPQLELPQQAHWQLDTGAVNRLDTAGALLLNQLLERLREAGSEVDVSAVPAAHQSLLDLVERSRLSASQRPPKPPRGLELVGRTTVAGWEQFLAFVTFVGEFSVDSLPRLLRPWRLRGKQIIAEIYKAGVTALPIVGLLAFLMGLVIAYQGGIPLEEFGANIFLVDLVAITMLREMAPLVTAIVVAGRSGSSYTAQIGTMRITEEVDALRALGLSHYDILALPKLVGLLIALPLLTVFANILGIAGGVVVAQAMFGIDYQVFLARMPEALSNTHFWVGMIKTPVFAVLIALIGCFHGFRVSGSAESVGRATTVSVVQGIFLVITADALFSIIFNMLDM